MYLKISLCISVVPPFPHTGDPNTTYNREQNTLHVLLSMDMVGQVDVFRHYGYMLSMYSTQVGIL